MQRFKSDLSHAGQSCHHSLYPRKGWQEKQLNHTIPTDLPHILSAVLFWYAKIPFTGYLRPKCAGIRKVWFYGWTYFICSSYCCRYRRRDFYVVVWKSRRKTKWKKRKRRELTYYEYRLSYFCNFWISDRSCFYTLHCNLHVLDLRCQNRA